jgi:hypothetical protein
MRGRESNNYLVVLPYSKNLTHSICKTIQKSMFKCIRVFF